MQALDLLALDAGLDGGVELDQRLHGRQPRGTHGGLKMAVVAGHRQLGEDAGDATSRAPVRLAEPSLIQSAHVNRGRLEAHQTEFRRLPESSVVKASASMRAA